MKVPEFVATLLNIVLGWMVIYFSKPVVFLIIKSMFLYWRAFHGTRIESYLLLFPFQIYFWVIFIGFKPPTSLVTVCFREGISDKQICGGCLRILQKSSFRVEQTYRDAHQSPPEVAGVLWGYREVVHFWISHRFSGFIFTRISNNYIWLHDTCRKVMITSHICDG